VASFTAFVSPSPNLHVRKTANANLEGFPTTFLKVKNTENNPEYSLCRTVQKLSGHPPNKFFQLIRLVFETLNEHEMH
jgi:hypothetical protein